jgi:hypothetical protein
MTNQPVRIDSDTLPLQIPPSTTHPIDTDLLIDRLPSGVATMWSCMAYTFISRDSIGLCGACGCHARFKTGATAQHCHHYSAAQKAPSIATDNTPSNFGSVQHTSYLHYLTDTKEKVCICSDRRIRGRNRFTAEQFNGFASSPSRSTRLRLGALRSNGRLPTMAGLRTSIKCLRVRRAGITQTYNAYHALSHYPVLVQRHRTSKNTTQRTAHPMSHFSTPSPSQAHRKKPNVINICDINDKPEPQWRRSHTGLRDVSVLQQTPEQGTRYQTAVESVSGSDDMPAYMTNAPTVQRTGSDDPWAENTGSPRYRTRDLPRTPSPTAEPASPTQPQRYPARTKRRDRGHRFVSPIATTHTQSDKVAAYSAKRGGIRAADSQSLC